MDYGKSKNQKSNYLRFINNWLKKSQDKAPRIKSTDNSVSETTRQNIENLKDWRPEDA